MLSTPSRSDIRGEGCTCALIAAVNTTLHHYGAPEHPPERQQTAPPASRSPVRRSRRVTCRREQTLSGRLATMYER